MARIYSRLARTEQRRNIQKTAIYISLTIVTVVLLFIYGLPLIVKLAAFLTDLRSSNQLVEQTDTTPPAPPSLEAPPEVTNRTNIDVKGTSEPGSSVIISANNRKDEILTNKDGLFTYNFALNKGDNTISAVAKDQAGNESQISKVYTIVYDNTPPTLEVTSPQDGASFYGSKQRQIVIEGKVEDAESLKINDRVVIIESDGTFTYAVSLQEGDNNFEVIAEDKAGNQEVKRLTFQFWS
jgi:hypothetical protein